MINGMRVNNPKVPIAISLLLIVVVALLLFNRNKEANGSTTHTSMLPEVSARNQNQVEPENLKVPKLGKTTGSDFDEIAARVIKSHANSAESLCAIYAITVDKRYLDEMLNRLNDDPKYGIQLIQAYKSDLSERALLDFTKKVLDKFPDRLELNFFYGGFLGKNRAPSPELKEILEKLPTNSKLDFGGQARYQIIREALMEGGQAVETAWIQGYAANIKIEFSRANIANGYITILKDSSKLSQEDQVQTASLLLKAVKIINPKDNYIEMDGLVATNLEKSALSRLDSNTEYGTNGKTVKDRLTELNFFDTERKRFEGELRPYLYSQSPALIQAFLEMKEIQGLTSAIKWLDAKKLNDK